MRFSIKQLKQLIKEESENFLKSKPGSLVESRVWDDDVGVWSEDSNTSDSCLNCQGPLDWRGECPDCFPEDIGNTPESFTGVGPINYNESHWIGPDDQITDRCPMCQGTYEEHEACGCDYEQCGYCNFDHSYEPEQANAFHLENDPEGLQYK